MLFPGIERYCQFDLFKVKPSLSSLVNALHEHFARLAGLVQDHDGETLGRLTHRVMQALESKRAVFKLLINVVRLLVLQLDHFIFSDHGPATIAAHSLSVLCSVSRKLNTFDLLLELL